MESSDEDEFGGGIESAVDEPSGTSDSVDGIINQDKDIFGRHDAQWNKMNEKPRAFKECHGHCELFWAVDRFTFILNTPTYTSLIFLLALQVKCHALTHNWAIGSTISVHAPKMA
jgi:hypothetical protein